MYPEGDMNISISSDQGPPKSLGYILLLWNIFHGYPLNSCFIMDQRGGLTNGPIN